MLYCLRLQFPGHCAIEKLHLREIGPLIRFLVVVPKSQWFHVALLSFSSAFMSSQALLLFFLLTFQPHKLRPTWLLCFCRRKKYVYCVYLVMFQFHFSKVRCSFHSCVQIFAKNINTECNSPLLCHSLFIRLTTNSYRRPPEQSILPQLAQMTLQLKSKYIYRHFLPHTYQFTNQNV